MKKILIPFLLFISSAGWSAYFPTALSTAAAVGSTTAVVNAVGQTLAVTGSGNFNVIGSTVGVVGTGGSYIVTGSSVGAVQVTSPWVVSGSGQFNVIGSTVGVINGNTSLSVQPIGTSTITHNGISQPVNLTQFSTVTFNGSAQPVTGSGQFNVIGSTVGAIGVGQFNVMGSTVGVIGVGGSYVVTGSSVGVSGTAAVGVAPLGNPVHTGLKVTSTTIPTAQIDGTMISVAGSNIGQLLTTGIPYGLIVSTFNSNISAATTEAILISSPAASTYSYLCGCLFNNSSATNNYVTIFASSSTPTTNDFMQIGTPANDIPAGLWPGCMNPFFRSKSGGQVTIRANAAVTSTSMRCVYYQGP